MSSTLTAEAIELPGAVVVKIAAIAVAVDDLGAEGVGVELKVCLDLFLDVDILGVELVLPSHLRGVQALIQRRALDRRCALHNDDYTHFYLRHLGNIEVALGEAALVRQIRNDPPLFKAWVGMWPRSSWTRGIEFGEFESLRLEPVGGTNNLVPRESYKGLFADDVPGLFHLIRKAQQTEAIRNDHRLASLPSTTDVQFMRLLLMSKKQFQQLEKSRLHQGRR